METDCYPSNSIEQQLAHKEILSLLNKSHSCKCRDDEDYKGDGEVLKLESEIESDIK